ncbi:MAG: tetratricopeptide repeat protein [Elusimicrobia bacterium]|nr:tetratricopeptide repeat protein [Elusimicrobiota bacterium]
MTRTPALSAAGLSLLFWAAVCSAQGTPAELYAAADYSGAVAGYAALVADQPRSASLHYNLGNSLFKDGQLGRAIAEYQRAFDLRPRDRDIRHNLGFALKRAGEDLVPPGVPPFLHYLFHLLSGRELAGLHWLACWATLILASAALLRRSAAGAIGWWGAGALAAWLFFGGWWGARAALEPSERAVVIKATAEIRSGPGDGFSVAFTAPEGRRVSVLSENGRWLEIGLDLEGAKGWVLADSVERVGEP